MPKAWPELITAFDALWREPQRSDLPALSDETRKYSYRQLHAAVGAQAGWLRQQGVRPGDRVAVVMERHARQVVMILAVMAIGACPCPVEPRLSEEESRRRSRVAAFRWAVFDHASETEALNCGLEDTHTLEEISFDIDSPVDWPEAPAPVDDGLLLFTSGSSGKPKGVVQNHRGLLSNALGIVAHTALDTRDKLLHVMPLFHTNGVNNQLLAPLLAGGCIVLAPRFKADDVPALLERHRPTLLTGVPTMYSRMLPLTFSQESVAALRMLRCGSAPITEELHRRIEAKFGLPLVVSYGLSEATCTSTMNPPLRRKIGSVGTVLQGQSVFLRGPDGQTLCGPGINGEICVSGPSLMSGYLQDGANGVVSPVGEVLRTGDLGHFDSDGYLFITGRLKDVIIRGGENLSPTQIEDVIAALPGVAACCVVGKADADLGEVPVAFVIRQPGAAGEQLSSASIEQTVRQRLSRIHQPAFIRFVDGLPEMAIGKVDRKKVREWAQA